MSSSSIEKTFFGFWPADDNHSHIDGEIPKEEGAKNKIQKALKEKLVAYDARDWQIIVCKDYLFLLHLKPLEEQLNDEREHNQASEIYDLRLAASRRIKSQYVEALNALYFLIYTSSFTGRGNFFLHDFAEVTAWQCLRIMYSQDNQPLRRIQFGRGTKKELHRSSLYSLKDSKTFSKIDIDIFADAAHYWDIVYNQDLVSLASVGTKIISEHRLESYDLSVVLAWFEIESWIASNARTLGVPTTRTNARGRTYHHRIIDIINHFPIGTTISNLTPELHEVREIRNGIAHSGMKPSQQQSAKAITLFVKMFNMRTGLNLRVDTNGTPSGGI